MKNSIAASLIAVIVILLFTISCNKKDISIVNSNNNATKDMLLSYLYQQKKIDLNASSFIDTLISKSNWSNLSETSISKDVKLIYVPLNYSRNRIGISFLYNNNTQSVYYSLITETPLSLSSISPTKNPILNKPSDIILPKDAIRPIDVIAGFYKYNLNGHTGSIKAFSLSNSFLWEYGYQNGNRKYERYITNSNIVNESNKTSPKQSYSVGSNLFKTSGCTLYYLVTYYYDGSIDREFIGSICDDGNDCQTTIGISEGSDIIKADCGGGGPGGGGSGNGDFDKIINDITDPCLKELVSNLQKANRLSNEIGSILQNLFGDNNSITLTFIQDDNLTDRKGNRVKGSSSQINNNNYITKLNNAVLKDYSPESQTLTIMHEVLHNSFKILYNDQKNQNDHTRMLTDYIEKLASSLENLYPELKLHHAVTIALCFDNLRGSVSDEEVDIKQSDFDAALNYYAKKGLFDLNDPHDWQRKAIDAKWANKEDSPLGSSLPCSKNKTLE